MPEGLEQTVGILDSGARVGKTDDDAVLLDRASMVMRLILDAPQGVLAVGRQVHKDVQKSVALGGDRREVAGNRPIQLRIDLREGRLDDDPELLEKLAQIDGRRGLLRGGAEFGRDQLAEPLDQRAQRLEIFVALDARTRRRLA